jgi:FixJ family two-component response regulator
MTAPEKRARAEDRPAHDRPEVLVVVGDPAVRASMQFALETEGLAVRVLATGADLLAIHRWPRRGCLVIDQNLPGMDGVDLIDRLRDRGIAMPTILLAAFPDRTLKQRAAATGTMVVEKPLLGSALTEALRTALASLAARSDP